ncbi:MAG: hypothetical protein M3415_09390 [Actinomycetota bacterium]|nr:hypothetical protein [Actinomycetota bacterium]
MVAALAHGLIDIGPLPVPANVLLGGSGGVLLGAAALASRHRPAAYAPTSEPSPSAALLPARRSLTRTLLRIVGALLLLAIVVPAALGPADVAANPAPRLLFTVLWAGLLPASLLFGPVWRACSPLRGLASLLAEQAPRALPAGLGVWPAVVAAVVFSGVEQLSGQSAPLVLAFLAVYALAQLAGIAVYGPAWLAAADLFEVYSTVLGRLAPIGRDDRGRVRWRRPLVALSTTAVPPGLPALVAVLVGAGLYDGAVLAGLPGGAMALAARMGAAASVLVAGTRPGWLAPALLPLLAGQAAAHYLGPLLVDTQVAVVLAADPFARGWDLLGLSGAEIVDPPLPGTLALWLQLALLVGGHVLAIVLAQRLTAARHDARTAGAVQFSIRLVVLASLLAAVWLRFVGPA